MKQLIMEKLKYFNWRITKMAAKKRGRPRRYIKKGVLHKMEYDSMVKGHYLNFDNKKTNFEYPVPQSIHKDSVLDMISKDKGIDTYDIINLEYAVVRNNVKAA